MNFETLADWILRIGPLALIPAIYGFLRWFCRLRFRHALGSTPFTTEAFFSCVLNGDSEIRRVNLFLRGGVDPDLISDDGWTALTLATRDGQIRIVRLLLDKSLCRRRADMNRPNRIGLSPLAVAVAARRGTIEKLLVELGADVESAIGARLIRAVEDTDAQRVRAALAQRAHPDSMTLTGETALMLAAGKVGDVRMVRALLEGGADVNAETSVGRTPLMSAAEHGRIMITQILLEAGAEVNARDQNGIGALRLAQLGGFREVEAILSRAGAIPTGYEVIDLLKAILDGKSEKVRDGLRMKADFRQLSPEGRPLVSEAAILGRLEALEALIEAGADLDRKGRGGRSPLQEALRHHQTAAARRVLEAGASTDLADDEGNTPTHVASEMGETEILGDLLAGGPPGRARPGKPVDVDQPNLHGATALLLATRSGQTAAVQMLLRAKADPDTVDGRGSTPLQEAVLAGFDDIADLLREAGATKGEREANLTLAAARGDVDTVRGLLKADADPNVQSARGRSPLIGASQNGRTAVVEALLGARGFLPETLSQVDRHGNSALMLASREGHDSVVELLLSAGADPNETRRDGSSALMYAARNGHVEAVRRLLDGGAEVNGSRHDGRSALMLAAERGHTKACETLVRAGANVEATSRYGESALMLAILVGHADVRELLVANGATRGQQEADLYMAASSGKATKVQEMIDAQVSPDVRVARGKTPLLVAVERNHIEVVRVLIQAGARVNVDDWENTTPLLRAAQKGRRTIAIELIQHGAGVNARGPGRITPLIAACEHGHTKTARELVKNGADVEAADAEGRTPLMIAIMGGQSEAELFLREAGATRGQDEADLIVAAELGREKTVKGLLPTADVNAVGFQRRSALFGASAEGHSEVVDLLLEAGADVDLRGPRRTAPLQVAARAGHADIIGRLLAAGAMVDLPGDRRRTALMEAAQADEMEVLETLLKVGANVNAADIRGYSALMLAAEEGNLEVVDALLGAGAEVNALGPEDQTALMLATRAGQAECMNALLTAGAMVDAKDADGATSLIQAAGLGDLDSVEALIASGANVNAADHSGNTPLMASILGQGANFQAVEDALRATGAKSGEDEARLLRAARDGNQREVTELIQGNKVNINARRRGEDSALILALHNGHVDIAEELLRAGADVRVKGLNGRTSLMGAIRLGNLSLVAQLIEKDACEVIEAVEVVSKDDGDEAPPLLTAATLAHWLGLDEILDRILKDCGALAPDDRVFIMPFGDRYHIAGCSFVKAGREAVFLHRALQLRLRPCGTCVRNQ